MAVGLSVAVDRLLLDKEFSATDYTPPVTHYLALSSTPWAEDGTGGTEGTGNYARQSITNNATNWPAASGTPASKQNGTALSFVAATSAWFAGSRAKFWAIYSLVTAGVMRVTGRLTGTPKVATADASTDFFTSTAHGYVLNTPVVFEVENGSLPTGVDATNIFYVRDQTANTFKVAAAPGGAAIDITANGSGTIWVAEDRSVDVQNGTTVTIPIGGITIQQV